MSPNWIAVGAVSGAVTVTLGALGAHALEARLEDREALWHTAVHYQGLHALALVAFGLLREQRTGGAATGWLLLLGTLLFSGSLYLWALGGPRWLVHVTPIGGVSFIAAWVTLALAARGSTRTPLAPTPGGPAA